VAWCGISVVEWYCPEGGKEFELGHVLLIANSILSRKIKVSELIVRHAKDAMTWIRTTRHRHCQRPTCDVQQLEYEGLRFLFVALRRQIHFVIDNGSRYLFSMIYDGGQTKRIMVL
jgi:hypothetical protein